MVILFSLNLMLQNLQRKNKLLFQFSFVSINRVKTIGLLTMVKKLSMNSKQQKDLLYFGSSECLLDTVPGICFPFTDETFIETTDEDLKKKSLERNILPQYKGPEYMTLILPSIPGTDPKLNKLEKDLKNLPKELQTPLIKSKEGKILGYHSGVRSAILPLDGKFFRLKGCGNMFEKFPLQQLSDETRDDLVEIRGCTFEHTSSRELLYFGKINKLMMENNIPVSNISLGNLKYFFF